MAGCFSEATLTSIIQAVNTVLIALVTGLVSVKMAQIRAQELKGASQSSAPGGRRASDVPLPLLRDIGSSEDMTTKDV